jgi:hypothetical protein
MTATARTPKTATATTTVESPSAAASRYQQLRSHLAELKLTAAAEALPAVLDQASSLSPWSDCWPSRSTPPPRAGWPDDYGLPAYPPRRPWPTSMSMPRPVSTAS